MVGIFITKVIPQVVQSEVCMVVNGIDNFYNHWMLMWLCVGIEIWSKRQPPSNNKYIFSEVISGKWKKNSLIPAYHMILHIFS